MRENIGNWANTKSFMYYKKHATYNNLPHYIEILVSWGYKRYGFWSSVRKSFKGEAWVVRNAKTEVQEKG